MLNKGVVVWWNKKLNIGKILSTEDIDFYFKKEGLLDNINVGDKVEFHATETQSNHWVTDIKLLNT